MNLTPANLMLRCFAEQADGQWQAVCLDFCLAAQGDSFEEARGKLHAMIVEYVQDALTGEDREFADQLLRRRAPFSLWARYYRLVALSRVGAMQDGFRRLFTEPLPLVPQQV